MTQSTVNAQGVNVIHTERSYQSIALVDLSYLFKVKYHGAGIGAPPNAGAERTLDELREISAEVDHMIVCLDYPPYHRRDRYEPYKAQRETPPAEEIGQKKALIEQLKHLGYRAARAKSFEADDCIATLAWNYSVWCPDVRIVATDKDAAQCITERVTQYVPAVAGRPSERRNRAACFEKFGVYPEEMRLFQALMGDKDDNIPGVRTVGKVKAKTVIEELRKARLPPDLAGLAAYIGEHKKTGGEWTAIAAQWESLKLSLELVTLELHVPLDIEGLLEKRAADPRPVPAPMGVELELFEGNETPMAVHDQPLALDPAEHDRLRELYTGEPPRERLEEVADHVQQSYPRTSREAALEAADRVLKPRIGKDPNADAVLQEKAEERNADRAAREQHEREKQKEREAQPRPGVAKAQVRVTSGAPANDAPPVHTAGTLLDIGPHVAISSAAEAARVTSIIKQTQEYGLVDARLQPMDLQAARTLSVWFHKGGLYVKKFGSPEAIFTIMMRGLGFGMNVQTALEAFHIVEGKPSTSADAIRALAERDPNCEYFMLVSSDDEHATWETKHRKQPRPRQYTYTIERAKKVPQFWVKDRWGGDPNWVKIPEEMLVKTAGSKLARIVYPGAVLGLYCPEELNGGVIDAVGEAA